MTAVPLAPPDAPRPRVIVVPGWARLAAALAVPATVVGAVLYTNVQLNTMPLLPAVSIVLLAAAGLLFANRPRLLVLLPLIAAYLPSPQVGFAAYVISLGYVVVEFGGVRLATPLDRIDWSLLAVLGWSVLSWAANLGEQTDTWSLVLFTITFLSPWLVLFFARVAPWETRDLRAIMVAWLGLAAVQAVPAVIKPILMGEPGAYSVPLLAFELTGAGLLRNLMPSTSADLTTGTMISAHHLGSALLLLCVLLVSYWIIVRDRRVALLAVLFGYVFLMTDSKHLVLGALPGVVWYLAVVVWPRFSRATRRRVNVAVILGTIVVGTYVARAVTAAVSELWQPYLVLASVNPKAQLFSRTAKLLGQNSLETWIGYGPGAFGSRAASIRATDVLYKEENRLPSFVPPHTAPAYASVAYDLYTSEILETVKFKSAALTNPFSSLLGIVAEYGLIGTVVVGTFFIIVAGAAFRAWSITALAPEWRAAAATAGFAIPYLMGISPFDTYFEQPDVTAPIIMLLLVGLVSARAPAPITRGELGGG